MGGSTLSRCPWTPGRSTGVSTGGRTELPGRTPPVLLHAAPAPGTGSAARQGVLRRGLHPVPRYPAGLLRPSHHVPEQRSGSPAGPYRMPHGQHLPPTVKLRHLPPRLPPVLVPQTPDSRPMNHGDITASGSHEPTSPGLRLPTITPIYDQGA